MPDNFHMSCPTPAGRVRVAKSEDVVTRAGGEVYSAVNGLWNHQWSQGKGKGGRSYGAWSLLSVRMMYPKKLRELEVGKLCPRNQEWLPKGESRWCPQCAYFDFIIFFLELVAGIARRPHLHMQRTDTYSYYCYHCSMNIYDYVIVKYIFESELTKLFMLLPYLLCWKWHKLVLFPFSSDE